MRESIQRSELLRHAHSLVRMADSLGQSEDFPTDTAAGFCQLIARTAEYVAENLPHAPKDKLPYAHTLLKEFCEHLAYPETSKISQTPWSIVQATEQLLQTHVGNEFKFIIRPQWEYNYGIIGDFVDHYRRNISALHGWLSTADWEAKVGPLAKEHIYCISFPRLERLNVLTHVNWGHELGHILADRWLNTNFDPFWNTARGSIEGRIRADLTSSGVVFTPVRLNAKVAQLTKQVMDLTIVALKELISDAVGVHLFGPAALASLFEFSCQHQLDISPLNCQGYPPWRYRLRLTAQPILDELNSIDTTAWIPEMKRYEEWLKMCASVTTDTTDQTVLKSHILTREAYELVEPNWAAIQAQVIIQLPPSERTPFQLLQRYDALADLVQRIDCGIPPSETGIWPNLRAALPADIWNAAWAWKISAFRGSTPEVFSEKLELLFLLALKAIESSFVQKTFGPKLP